MENSFPGKVLIIDDDVDTISLYSRFLIEAGYQVDTALNGKDGYAKILQGGFDLVLLDLIMPELDGLSILRKIRQKQILVW